MDKIKIITDSTSDLPKDIIEKYDIEVLPLIVNFGDKSYLDNIDITLSELLTKIDEEDIFPTTAQVNPQRFSDCYEKYLKEGYKILSIHISSKLSGTYQSACIAKNMLESDNITVVDSLNVTLGLGLLVLKACTLNEKGLSINDIEQELLKTVPHIKSAIAFEKLDNLVKGGRLSKTAGTIGNILGIKPIIAITDGEIAVMDKVRGSKKAVRTIIDYMESIGIKEGETCAIIHIGNEDMLDALRNTIQEKNIDPLESQVGCVIGVHAGKSACGVFFIEKY